MQRDYRQNGPEAESFERGVFTISLDFELIWGTLDLFGPDKFRRACEIERERVIDELLDLFVEFEFPATWCIVGHLFKDKCEGKSEHSHLVRANHKWVKDDWFDHVPCEHENDKSVFLARSLIEKIKNCTVEQEIGSHSFSHMIFGDEGFSEEVARSELAESVKLADEIGIKMKSFAFPRNSVGHLNTLKEFGFLCYRGVEPNWFEAAHIPIKLRRAMRLIDVLRAATPPTVMPFKHEPGGVWNVPGSAMYFPMHGVRRFIPLTLRTERIKKGLDAASKSKRVFHLWFHPTNMADETDSMFKGLRDIFLYARSLREEGKLDFLSMGQVVSAMGGR